MFQLEPHSASTTLPSAPEKIHAIPDEMRHGRRRPARTHDDVGNAVAAQVTDTGERYAKAERFRRLEFEQHGSGFAREYLRVPDGKHWVGIGPDDHIIVAVPMIVAITRYRPSQPITARTVKMCVYSSAPSLPEKSLLA
ncbi:MAG: hypothetical protein U1E76_16730 [Planctomycetota bacterium]